MRTRRAEREGFEPSIRLSAYAGLANRCLQPLGHLSGRIPKAIGSKSVLQPSAKSAGWRCAETISFNVPGEKGRARASIRTNESSEEGMLNGHSRAVTLVAAIGCIAAATSPLTVTEYQIPREGAFPHDPAVGRDGIVWYTDQQNSFIGRLDPATGKITDYPTPTPASGPHGIVVAPDGSVWYTAQRIGKLGRLDPGTGHIEEYSLPAEARDPHTPLIRKGIVWFTVQQSNRYGRFDPRTHDAKVWTVPTNRALPYGMVNAPDGSIWVALFGTNKLGRIDGESGALQEITLPDRGARPRRLAVDETGMGLYSHFARGSLGSYNP